MKTIECSNGNGQRIFIKKIGTAPKNKPYFGIRVGDDWYPLADKDARRLAKQINASL